MRLVAGENVVGGFRVYDALTHDEIRWVYEADTDTGEIVRYLTDENGEFYAVDEQGRRGPHYERFVRGKNGLYPDPAQVVEPAQVREVRPFYTVPLVAELVPGSGMYGPMGVRP